MTVYFTCLSERRIEFESDRRYIDAALFPFPFQQPDNPGSPVHPTVAPFIPPMTPAPAVAAISQFPPQTLYPVVYLLFV